jgi:WD40 repeat protein
MAFSPDSQTLAGLSGYRMDGTKPEIQLWDARSGRPIGQPLPVSRQGWAGYIAFSPNGQNVISLSGNRIETWTVSPNKWLAIACDRLRYHPLLSHPETITADPDFVKLTKRSKSACQRYAWDGP